MYNIQLSQQTQSQEKLVSVCTNSTYVQPYVFSKPFHNVTQIHAGELHQHQWTLNKRERTWEIQKPDTDDPDAQTSFPILQYASCLQDLPVVFSAKSVFPFVQLYTCKMNVSLQRAHWIGDIHRFLTSYDLYRNFPCWWRFSRAKNPRTYDVREHALSKRRKYLISSIV